MSDKVVPFPGKFSTIAPTPAEDVLKGAMDESLDQVVVLGFRRNGEFYVVANDSYLPDLNMLLDLAKAWVVKQWDVKE